MPFSLRAAAAVVALAMTALASKPVHIVCNENTAPIQIRLAYADDHSMRVSWNTKQQLSKPTVYFGTKGKLERSASSDVSVTYPTSSTYNNHVTITGLAPDTTYSYMPQCGTETLYFTTARSIGKGDEFKFAMVGDMGTFGPDGLSTKVGSGAKNPLKPGEKTTIDSLVSLIDSYDFVWHGLSSPSLAIIFVS
jgi:hypothetical protein